MRNRKAFTLVELLVVIAIIALLLSMLMPALNNAKEQARKVACSAKLHQMGLAAGLYSSDWNGYLPRPQALVSLLTGPIGPFDTDDGATVWPGYLLPYVGNNEKLFLCPAAFANSGRFITLPYGTYFTWRPPTYEVDMAYGVNWNIGFIAGMDSSGFFKAAKVNQIKNQTEFVLYGDRALLDEWIPFKGGGSTKPRLYGAGAQGSWLGPGPDDYKFSVWSTHFPAPRHSKKANLLFLDGHAATLPQLEAAKARLYGLDPDHPLF